jgi:hypothetical protein
VGSRELASAAEGETDKNKERYGTPEFHTSQEWAEERFVMVYLQGSDRWRMPFRA